MVSWSIASSTKILNHLINFSPISAGRKLNFYFVPEMQMIEMRIAIGFFVTEDVYLRRRSLLAVIRSAYECNLKWLIISLGRNEMISLTANVIITVSTTNLHSIQVSLPVSNILIAPRMNCNILCHRVMVSATDLIKKLFQIKSTH